VSPASCDSSSSLPPSPDCSLCPRLEAFRQANRISFPKGHNAPVPSFAPSPVDPGEAPWLLIVGLAPGLRGANLSGRPFTGDFAGDLLYPTLVSFGLAEGSYGAKADDGLRLSGCRITNAVRCVPPQNKVTGAEVKACRPFLKDEIASLERLEVILALGVVAHRAVLGALGEVISAFPFAHGAFHSLSSGLELRDSYHCSRYNTNTGRLTEDMFRQVFEALMKRRPG
jgi:uracil-DNA glycosylase